MSPLSRSKSLADVKHTAESLADGVATGATPPATNDFQSREEKKGRRPSSKGKDTHALPGDRFWTPTTDLTLSTIEWLRTHKVPDSARKAQKDFVAWACSNPGLQEHLPVIVR